MHFIGSRELDIKRVSRDRSFSVVMNLTCRGIKVEVSLGTPVLQVSYVQVYLALTFVKNHSCLIEIPLLWGISFWRSLIEEMILTEIKFEITGNLLAWLNGNSTL